MKSKAKIVDWSVRYQKALGQLAQALITRTAESKASHQRLEKGIVRRKKAEAALVKSHANHAKLTHISEHLSDLLRKQTHAILLTQEKERTKNSRGLQDQIGQALLGISIELLALQKSDKACATRFVKELESLNHYLKLTKSDA
jgi:signal transduction histidine kinase